MDMDRPPTSLSHGLPPARLRPDFSNVPRYNRHTFQDLLRLQRIFSRHRSGIRTVHLHRERF